MAIGAAVSTTVPKIESVPSLLSISSISRPCCGQSISAAVAICQNPLLPFRFSYGVISFSWMCPTTYAMKFGYLRNRFSHRLSCP